LRFVTLVIAGRERAVYIASRARTHMKLQATLLSIFIGLNCAALHAATYVVPTDDTMIVRADAIVIARALHSHVQESAERGIETVTVFAIEEVLKGDIKPDDGMSVRSPGGMIEMNHETIVKVVPGAPCFVDGDRVLLFVKKLGAGDYATTDLTLGSFGFATDDLGHRVIVRADSEINGWDPDGSLHLEPRRDADRFLRFIRDVINQRPAAHDYTIKAEPLAGESRSIAKTRLTPIALSAFTVTQYTFAVDVANENSAGTRWKTFPTAINWNRGNAEIHAANSGSDFIDAAFSSWNGDVSSNVNYVLTTANANPNGIFESPPVDGVNNIVFEKDMTAHGISAFDCTHGGVLGAGGVVSISGDPANIVNGEVFFKTVEADLSMNQGLGACLPGGTGQVAPGDYLSSLTHEVGHTLGFRHSDKSRNNSQACTNFANYECSSTAIMNHALVKGLAGALTAWDQHAVEALYPAPAPPANVVAIALNSTTVSVTWTAVLGAALYTVYRSADNMTYSTVGTPATNSFNDSSALPTTAYLYKVTATISGVASGDSNKDLATTVIFTDSAINAHTTLIKAAHITELRTAVDAVRKLAAGGIANNANYTNPVITPQSTPVKGIDVIELRNALDAARSTLGLPALSYTDAAIVAQSTLIKAVHIADLRNGVQ
jgi:hypothetical protein